MDDRLTAPTFPVTLNDRYGLEERLGAGSLGVVFRARHRAFPEDTLAIKILHPELAKDSDAMRRFFDEARVGSGVAHPNAVRIMDFGTSDGHTYLVMKLAPGLTLERMVREHGPLALHRIGNIGAQICDVLAAAHDKQLAHGALTPMKVIVSDDGADQATVLGFRVEGGDPRADQRALGALLYELATGRKPVHAQRPALPSHVTAPFVEAIHRLLADNPAEQYATVRDAGEALRVAARG